VTANLASPGAADPPLTWRKLYVASFWAAAVYNLAWGTTVILLPRTTLGLAGIETDAVGVLFWQCIGMFVLVFAIGYWGAARHPERYALFIAIALLGKILGPIGFVYGAFWLDALPRGLGWTIITNDLIWWPIWIPFVLATRRLW